MTQTIRDRILQYLSQHRDGIDDDELATALSLRYRQQANSRCRQLAKERIIERRLVGGKIRNFWKDSITIASAQSGKQQPIPSLDEPWFWEGNVQAAVCQYLQAQGYSIVRCADTKRRQVGKDIEAERNTSPLWVTVKGYPKGTPKTRATTQAGHWFKQALFDVISWRNENGNAEIAMAFPDYSRYRKLADKVAWLQPIVRFSFLWVEQDGSICVQGSAR